MPKRFQNAVQNFSAGVLSPRYSASIESEAFSRGLKQAKNFIISSQGGAVYREGLQHISYAPGNNFFKVFQFHRGGDVSDLVVEVSAGTIRYWIDTDGTPELMVDNVSILLNEDDGNFLTDEDGNYLTIGTIVSSNPYKQSDLASLYFTNQDKYGILCSTSHPPLYITSRADGVIIAELIPLERIPSYDYNDVNSPKISSELSTWRISFPASWQTSGFGYHVAYNNVYGGSLYAYEPTNDTNNAANIELSLEGSAAAQGYTTTFAVTPVTDVDGAYDITVSGENAGFGMAVYLAGYYFGGDGSGYLPAQMPPLAQQTDTDGRLEPAWSYPLWVFHRSNYWKCIRVHRSDATNEPGVGADWDNYWINLGITKPEGYDYQFPTGNAWDVAHGIYSPMDRGFPTVACFHQQRLIFMANKDNPTALYGSGIAQYQDYLVGANDDEAWMFILDSSDTPQIKWAVSESNLLLGTSSGEWTITAEVTLTPTDIHARRQNGARSQLGMPGQVDTDIMYIEQGGKKLRLTHYTDTTESFTSSDLSLLSEELVSSDVVRRLCVSHTPEVFIVMNRRNGDPVFLSVNKDSQVLAFTECDSEGYVYDSCSYFSLDTNQDYTYHVVNRNGYWVLERMRYPDSKLHADLTGDGVVHLDGWVTGTVDGNRIVDLGHLDGKQVGVLIDNAWQVEEYTVTNNQIVLSADHDGKTYAVGQMYTGLLQTFEVNDNFRAVGLGTKRRWNRLWTRLLNSVLPRVYGDRGPDRRPETLMGEPDLIREGIHDEEQTVTGFGDGSITIEHDRPYPLYVVGFFGEYQVEDR